MPDAQGNFKGITVPELPWQRYRPVRPIETEDNPHLPSDQRKAVEGDLERIAQEEPCR